MNAIAAAAETLVCCSGVMTLAIAALPQAESALQRATYQRQLADVSRSVQATGRCALLGTTELGRPWSFACDRHTGGRSILAQQGCMHTSAVLAKQSRGRCLNWPRLRPHDQSQQLAHALHDQAQRHKSAAA